VEVLYCPENRDPLAQFMKSALSLILLISTISPCISQTLNSADSTPMKENPKTSVPQVIMHTTQGDMTFEFWPDVAPKTVANFLKLTSEGFYKGTAFHRIIKGFMIQGGCPNSKQGARGMPGTGGPGYQIKAEFNNRSHTKGVLSMARSQDVDSAGSQFFICHGDASFLNNKYTAFGKLIKGEDVLDKIASIPCTGPERSSPTERVEITGIELIEQK
jgi:peptidyl-prolyl cis-trans isomerase B (cyclophilin B)